MGQHHHHRLHGLQSRLLQQLPYWLLALSVVPLVAGGVRLLHVANGSVAPGDARFSSAPLPVGSLLLVVRVVVGSAMLSFLLQGIAAILARDITRHQAMMARAYALGQGAGTQVILFIPASIVFGEITGLPRDVLMSAAWVLNFALVEALVAQRVRYCAPRTVAPMC